MGLREIFSRRAHEGHTYRGTDLGVGFNRDPGEVKSLVRGPSEFDRLVSRWNSR